MMPRDLLFAKAEKAGSVVVEDVSFLLLAQEASVQNRVDAASKVVTTYVRAVAFLDDGHSTEALVFVNSPANLDQGDVDLVELYTTVVDRRGRPVEGLQASDFEVRENGIPQTIRRFEWEQDLPIHAGLLIDRS